MLKVVPSRTVQGMKFPGAKYGLKMACGENPKRVYAQRGPSTRYGQRRRLPEGVDPGRRTIAAAGTNGTPTTRVIPPARDLGLETLAEVLRGNILVHMHCYRADEMAQMIDVSHEFGYQIRAFHHAVEAYKIADLLAQNDIARGRVGRTGADSRWSRSTPSARTSRLTTQAGARAMIHSDDPGGMQRLNQEVAKAMAAGAAAGVPIGGGAGGEVDDDQSGVGPGTRRPHRVARGWEERRRRAVVRQPLQRVYARRYRLDRRCGALRPERQ